jgi:hypothetical protein
MSKFLATESTYTIEKIYIYIYQKQADILSSHLSNRGASIQVVGVSDLQSFITTPKRCITKRTDEDIFCN